MFRTKLSPKVIVLLLCALVTNFCGQPAYAQGSSFNYQGHLKNDGQVVNGPVDLRFTLYASPHSFVSPVVPPQIIPNVNVVDGAFTATLDFGETAFPGANRWLGIEVSSPANNGSGPWTALSPRQQVMPTPYAMQAISSGTIDAGTHDNAVNFTNASNTFSGAFDGSFSGTGSGLTGLNAFFITSGLLNPQRLPNGGQWIFENALRFNAGGGDAMSIHPVTRRVAIGGSFGPNYPLDVQHSTAERIINAYSASTAASVSAIHGQSVSTTGRGVYGHASSATGANSGVFGESSSSAGRGVFGSATSSTGSNAGVWGRTSSATGRGVYGDASTNGGENAGVMGHSFSTIGSGVYGINTQFSGANNGVRGQSSSPDGRGVFGANAASTGNSIGVLGTTASTTGRGVEGRATAASGANFGGFFESASASGRGVEGRATAASGASFGGYFESASVSGRGIFAQNTAATGTNYAGQFTSNSTSGRGVYAVAAAASGSTRAVWGEVLSGSGFGAYFSGVAGSRNYFQRNVGIGTTNPQDMLHVNGATRTNVIHIMGGSDLAERFDVATIDDIVPEPGMVVCIDPHNPGKLMPSTRAYDRTVAGIVSGANGINSGMIMGQEGTEADGLLPIALSGRVYVMVDAHDSAIEPGDLLTTSDTPGHAMKAIDRDRRDGAVLGKAMTHLSEGERGMVMVLVSLQ